MPTAHLAVVVARRSFATPIFPVTPVIPITPARRTGKTGKTGKAPPHKNLADIFFNTREVGGAILNSQFSILNSQFSLPLVLFLLWCEK